MARRRRRPRRDRWLSLLELAQKLELAQPDPRVRRIYVQRVLARLGQRDGTTYLKRFGPGRGKLYANMAVLELLDPDDPAMPGRMRADIDQLGSRVGRLERSDKRQNAQLANLHEAGTKLAEAFEALTRAGSQNGSKTDHRSPTPKIVPRRGTPSR